MVYRAYALGTCVCLARSLGLFRLSRRWSDNPRAQASDIYRQDQLRDLCLSPVRLSFFSLPSPLDEYRPYRFAKGNAVRSPCGNHLGDGCAFVALLRETYQFGEEPVYMSAPNTQLVIP